MKFAFCTCVQLGLSCIEKIYEIGGSLDLLITLNDGKAVKKSGRIYLDDFAKANKVDLLKINHIDDQEVREALLRHEIDWLFIIGWSQIASLETISAAKLGTIGAHPTLLPLGRGRAAIPWAIIKGLDRTGVSFFKMDEGVDTGDILYQYEIPITQNETAATLYEKVNVGHELGIESFWNDLTQGKLKLVPQKEDDATYWPGRKPTDGELSRLMTLKEVDRLVRATTKPYPGAFYCEDSRKVIIWEGTTDQNAEGLRIDFADGSYVACVYEVEEIPR